MHAIGRGQPPVGRVAVPSFADRNGDSPLALEEQPLRLLSRQTLAEERKRLTVVGYADKFGALRTLARTVPRRRPRGAL
jgi:hypothetical protein